ncbi:hypothetical protein D0Z03_001777 [Geotrichum reessii]|nr:hypothetical protein D0Z03_001777 [Galactomyces reessii]
MKIATDTEVKDYTRAIVIGGLKGAAVGLGVSLGVAYWARGRQTIFNSMNHSFKTFFFLTPILGIGITATELASLEFDMEQYDFGESEKLRKAEREKIDNLPFLERAKVYGIENKYKIIVGAWAASLGGSFWWINRDKFLSKSQKIVQARMYAQALTVVILLGSMLMSVNSYQDAKKTQEEKYSWQSIVAQEEKREKEAGLPLRLTESKE